MSLDKILSISGKAGLYQIVKQTRSGAVVESLIDNKRITVGAHSNISILSEIAIYTRPKGASSSGGKYGHHSTEYT